MYRPNDSTAGQQNRYEQTSEWGASAAQDAWSHENFSWRGYRPSSRDNFDMQDELNDGLNFNIYDHFNQPNRAVQELHSGEDHLRSASMDVSKAARALNRGDSDSAMFYLRNSLNDIQDGIYDLNDGLRDNPNDSRKDMRGESRVQEGIDDVYWSRRNLSHAMRLLKAGDEDGAMQFLRQGGRALNSGRDEIDAGVDKIENANRGGWSGGWRGRDRGSNCEPESPACEEPEEPRCEEPEEPTCEKPEEPTCEKPEEPTCEKPEEPTCEEPEEPICEKPEEPCDPPFFDKAERHLIWGDPHIQDAKGNNVDDHIEANKNVLLLETTDGASITGHTASFDNPELRAQLGHDITVFDKEVVNLGDGQRIIMNSDGTAYRTDANGNIGAQLKDDEVIASTEDCNDKVTYDVETKSLTFSFVGDDKSTISGVITGNLDHRANYINTEVKTSTGLFGGFMPALRADFTGVKVNSQTGEGAFDPAQDGSVRTNKDFFVDSLYNE